MTNAAPDAAAFDGLMAALGPFEPNPHIAVAVSGGADSMALTILANNWVRQNSGKLYALTVDHRLRPESVEETRQVAKWMKLRSISHRILKWDSPEGGAGLQAAARDARYELLERWCASNGILHLLVGHHSGDQAETLLIRLGAGSGADGLAAMASITERPSVRVLRPLLRVQSEGLRAYLRRVGQDWIEDPSNQDPTFERVRIRRLAAAVSEDGLPTRRIAQTATKLGYARAAMESAVAHLCAATVTICPSGFAILNTDRLAEVPSELRRRALAGVIRAVGGRMYGPRSERLASLHQAVSAGGIARARTLGGVRIGPWRGRLLFSREPAAVAGAVPISLEGGEIVWDGRFRAIFSQEMPPDLHLGALGSPGVTAVRSIHKSLADLLPKAVWPTLPTIWRGDTVLAVPHLGYGRRGLSGAVKLRFAPPKPVCSPEFGIV